MTLERKRIHWSFFSVKCCPCRTHSISYVACYFSKRVSTNQVLHSNLNRLFGMNILHFHPNHLIVLGCYVALRHLSFTSAASMRTTFFTCAITLALLTHCFCLFGRASMFADLLALVCFFI